MKALAYSILLTLVTAGNAVAGNVLFVNYNGSDLGVPAALATDSHTVTAVDVPPATANTYFESANLDGYCAVVWSTAYAYAEDLGPAAATLSGWASSGGHLLITTPDGMRNDGTLAGLLGGAGATDNGSNFSTVANVANDVTTGLFDIRGQQPSYISDIDALCSPLAGDTVGLVTAERTGCSTDHEDPGYAWSLRSMGEGQIAFITSGNFNGNSTDEPDWTAEDIPGGGVYNAGLRNFVHAACAPTASPIPAASPAGFILLALLLGLGAVVVLHTRFA